MKRNAEGFPKRTKIKSLAFAVLMSATAAIRSACSDTTHPESEQKHKTEKTEKKSTQESKTITLEEKTNGTNAEADSDSQGRKIISTEKYKDEDEQQIKKKIYNDGSRSIEWKSESGEYSGYIEYYPNSNNKKFERTDFGKGNGLQEGTYAIYNNNGQILYYNESRLEEVDGAEQDNKYDNKQRLIYDAIYKATYTYDEGNRQVKEIRNLHTGDNKNKYYIITTYGMTSDNEIDYDNIISSIFIGETGQEINLMDNKSIENLIKDMNLENTPYIWEYEQLSN